MAPNDPVRYTLSFPSPQDHSVQVDAVLPAGGREALELFLPSWVPGYYKIQDYARHVGAVRALAPDGSELPVVKTAKNRWRIATGGAGEVRLSYRVHAGELSACANFVDPSFAFLNGAATFLGVAGHGGPYLVEVRPAGGWSEVIAPLEAPGPGPVFRASTYEELSDSPVYAGNPTLRRFQVRGVPHLLVNEGGRGAWDFDLAARDVERIVTAVADLWGEIPYRRYVFFNLIVDGFGGLEHGSSVAMLTGRWTTRRRWEYLGWLGFVAHEVFHAWNGRHLRPRELRSADWEREAYTRDLWALEGITSYYEHLLVERAGLSTPDELLGHLSTLIRSLQEAPGRLAQTLEEASFDAWIRFFQPDEDTVSSTVSFYQKGALVAWLLDTALRRETGGAASLDDVLREACRRFGGGAGLPPGAFERLAVELAGGSGLIQELLDRGLRTTAELDYSLALDWLGLQVGAGEGGGAPGGAWLGAETVSEEGRLLVRRVRRGTPAHRAGLAAHDELLALDRYRVPREGLALLLELFRPGDEVSLLVARRGELTSLAATLGEEPRDAWELAVRKEPGAAQREHLESWLRGLR